MNTLRHPCSRANSVRLRTSTAPRVFVASPAFAASPVLVCLFDGWFVGERRGGATHTYWVGGLYVRSAGCPLGCLSHWWRSVWLSVAGEGGVQRLVGLASAVLFKRQKLVPARWGHFRICGGKAFSLLHFFVAGLNSPLDKEMKGATDSG